MSCENKVYQNINPDAFEGIRKELGKINLDLPEAHAGTVTSSSYGVTADYKFDPEAQTMQLQVTDKPFFMPCSLIYKKLTEAIERVQNGA